MSNLSKFVYPDLIFPVSISVTSPQICINHPHKHYMWTYQHNPYLDSKTANRTLGDYKDSFICDYCVDDMWKVSSRKDSIKEKIKELSQYYYCNHCHYNNSIIPVGKKFFCNKCGLDLLEYMAETRNENSSYILRSFLKFFQELKVLTVYRNLPPSIISSLLYIYVNPTITEITDDILDWNNVRKFNRNNFKNELIALYEKIHLNGLGIEEETIGKRILQEVVSGNYE